MSKPRQIIQMVLAIGVMVLGIYMLLNFEWPTPPAISGLGFLMVGFSQWTPYCLLMKWIFKDE